MTRFTITQKTSLNVNQGYIGETIEEKVRRMYNNKEPLTDGVEKTYTDRKDGVLPSGDIRTDRFDVAIEGSTHIAKTKTAEREQRIGERTFDTMNEEQQKQFHEKFPLNKHNRPKEENKK